MQTIKHEPPFNRRALRWFRARVADILQGVAMDVPTTRREPLTGAEPYFDALLEWYCARARRFAYWTAAPHYHGRGFSAGHWTVFHGEVELAFEQAQAEATRAHAAEALASVPSLDAWLEADLAGTLPAAPIGGSATLAPAQREALRTRKGDRELRARLRKTCPSCGARWAVRSGLQFPHDLNAKRCPDCRAATQPSKARRAAK